MSILDIIASGGDQIDLATPIKERNARKEREKAAEEEQRRYDEKMKTDEAIRAEDKRRWEEEYKLNQRSADRLEKTERRLQLDADAKRNEERMARSAATSAIMIPALKEAIETGDYTAVDSILSQRKGDIDAVREKQIKSGLSEDRAINKNETVAFESLVKENPQQALKLLENDVAIAERLKLIDTTKPSEFGFRDWLNAPDEVRQSFIDFTAAKKPPSTQVNVNTNPETGEKLTIGQTVQRDSIEKRMQKVEEDYATNRVDLAKTEHVIQRLEEGVETGKLSAIKIFANQLGLEISEDATDLEVFDAILTEDIIPKVKQLGVNPTDFDFKQVKKAMSNVEKSAAANYVLSDFKRQILKVEEEKKMKMDELNELGVGYKEINKAFDRIEEAANLRLMTISEAQKRLDSKKAEREGIAKKEMDDGARLVAETLGE